MRCNDNNDDDRISSERAFLHSSRKKTTIMKVHRMQKKKRFSVKISTINTSDIIIRSDQSIKMHRQTNILFMPNLVLL
jgi:hypothetical protein